MDEVEFFNRALSAAEILAIYNAGSAGKCKSGDQCQQNLAAAQQQIQSLQGQLAAANTTIQNLTQANQTLTAANAALQTQVNTLMAEKAALQTQVNTLTAEKAALQTQVNTLMAENAALTSGLSSGLDGIEQTLQLLFDDPQFQIPGATLLEQYQNLVNAIKGLNKGRLEGLYKALGGKK
jgi:chromosome segregation ATPase